MKSINDLLNKSKKTNFPDSFKINDTLINDKKNIATKFYEYLTNIGPKLTNGILPSRYKKCYGISSPSSQTINFQYFKEDYVNELISK